MLSEKDLEDGRQRLRAQDLDGFIEWHEHHFPLRNTDMVRKLMHTCFLTNPERAIKHFDDLIADQNPTTDAVRFIVTMISIVILVALTAIVVIGSLASFINLIWS